MAKKTTKKLNAAQVGILRTMGARAWALRNLADGVGMLPGPAARCLGALVDRGYVTGSSVVGYKRTPDGKLALKAAK